VPAIEMTTFNYCLNRQDGRTHEHRFMNLNEVAIESPIALSGDPVSPLN
jgi:hypothetical protein